MMVLVFRLLVLFGLYVKFHVSVCFFVILELENTLLIEQVILQRKWPMRIVCFWKTYV